MRTVKIIFTAFFLTVMLNACTSNEDVSPRVSPDELEKFEVKNNGGGLGDKTPGTP